MKTIIDLFEVKEDSHFPTTNCFEKLSKQLKDNEKVKIFNNGTSQNGKSLIAFAIGKGKKVIGVTAGAHADEPIGVLTLKYFIQGIINNSQFNNLLDNYTFLCHPLVDPDGYNLNSKWFTNPIEYTNYFLNNYRNNNPALDCEHGMPIQEGQSIRPEMEFIKENLNKYKDRFEYYVTLHSSHVLPGACFVFDQDNKNQQLRDTITLLCKEYNLPMMDYKVQGEGTMTYLGPGFIGAPNVSMMLEKYKNQPEILSQIKMTTYEYAQSVCGAKTAFISELPIWLSSGFDNYEYSNISMNEFMEQSFKEQKKYVQQLKEVKNIINEFTDDETNIWLKTLSTSIKRGEAHLQDEEKRLGTHEGFAQEMLISELEVQEIEFEAKALRFAIKTLENVPNAKKVVSDFQNKFNEKISIYERKMKLNQLSIKTQVEIQLGLIFSGIENLKALM